MKIAICSNSFVNIKECLYNAMAYMAVMSMLITVSSISYAEEEPDVTGSDIVKRCGNKYPGKDQTSKFTVILTDNQGNQKKSVYLRLWKNYQGSKGIVDKMILFTEYPPDAKDTAFMRIAYTPDIDKNADQWVYLPLLVKTRRVTIRDPGDSFLNSDLTYADISYHSLDEFEYKLMDIQTYRGEDHYVVESKPKGNATLYNKRVLWFTKKPDWEDCANVRIDYYDMHGDLLKKQEITWQRIKDAWIWDRVKVNNIQTSHSSEFIISDVAIDTGLQDRIFSERTLKIGPSVINH